MIFLICILIIIIVFLLAYISFMKKEMVNISKQLNEHNDFKTEKKIDINIINKEVELLAESINRHIQIANELKQQEIKSKERLKEMIANISHDLRTPLTSIIGYVQIIKIKSSDFRNNESNIKNIEYLNKVENRSRDLQAMLEDLFTLSVLDNTDYNLNLECIDISEIVCDSLVGFYEQLEKRGIEPNININKVSKIIGESKSITRVIENLMSNILKYSSEYVEIELFESKDRVNLIIMNSLEENKKIDTENIFDKFNKGNDKSRSVKSTGLGLYIVKTLMEKMNGSVSAKQVDNRLYIACYWEKV